MATALKHYRRKLPFYIKARPLVEGEIVFDANGVMIEFFAGDMLIELETDRYRLDRRLFDQLYEEIQINANGNEQSGAPSEPA